MANGQFAITVLDGYLVMTHVVLHLWGTESISCTFCVVFAGFKISGGGGEGYVLAQQGSKWKYVCASASTSSFVDAAFCDEAGNPG